MSRRGGRFWGKRLPLPCVERDTDGQHQAPTDDRGTSRVSHNDSQRETDREARRAADRLLLRVSRRGGVPLALLV